MLWVYEIEGGKYPGDAPASGLEGIWPEGRYYYLFYSRDAEGLIRPWIENHPDRRLASQYNLPLEKWQDLPGSQIAIGPFLIEPFKHGSPPAPGKIPLRIDPGIVFGSGVHPTTRGCLLALSDLFARERIRSALDFGTGTGILAIACAILGATTVWAVDCNPAAIQNAAKNVAANGLAHRIGLVAADSIAPLAADPDLLLMNIEWPIAKRVLEAGDWRRGRWIILSGFLASRRDAVEGLAAPGYRVETVSACEGWPVMTLRRTS